MIEKMADDLIGQMTEARLIDKDMEERYIYQTVDKVLGFLPRIFLY